jgi:Tol biopolymer transport system component
VRDIVNNTIVRANIDGSGIESNNYSEAIVITPDGRYVLFNSYADNLVANDTNYQPDVFVKDLQLDTLYRISSYFNYKNNDYIA